MLFPLLVFLPGVTPSNPATSCAEIFSNLTNAASGYYWLKSSNGSAVNVYCNMSLTCKGVSGGWMQVVKLNMSDSNLQCLSGTSLTTVLTKRLCRNSLTGPGCSSTIFYVHGIEYRRVCGKIIAYQFKSPDAFRSRNPSNVVHDIDQNYVDGISLTYGNGPRQHIWSFAAAVDEGNVVGQSQPPNFVGNEYFCDTGRGQMSRSINGIMVDDPLWDGAGCGQVNPCCSLNNPPWFLKQLPSSTIDNIEMRMCRDEIASQEGSPFEIIELYVR